LEFHLVELKDKKKVVIKEELMVVQWELYLGKK
jgi:hypothetical protein